jgi:hypothetical protein
VTATTRASVYAPVYAAEEGEDVPRPLITKATVRRRNREKNERYLAKNRALIRAKQRARSGYKPSLGVWHGLLSASDAVRA